jgi:hypothetical protein
LALVVPVEVGGRIVEALPGAVDKVPSAAERIKREVVLARFLGKMVVDQGVREVRTRLPLHDAPSAAAGTSAPAPVVSVGRSDAEVPDSTPSADIDVDAPDVASLALADYDHLSSAQIVGKLGGLDVDERRAIERYERAGRHRRTILGKLAQLGVDG